MSASINKFIARLDDSKRLALKLVASQGASKALQLGSNLLLTRLLVPEAFGLMVIINTVILGIYMISDLGLGPVVVHHKDGTQIRFLNTVWTIQIIRGAGIAVVAACLAWPIAKLYGHDELTALLIVCAIAPFISGFDSISLLTAERRMKMGHVIIVNLSVQLCGIVVMALLAYIYKTVWALIAGTLACAVIKLLLSHLCLQKHPHKIGFDKESVAKIKTFAQWILLSTLCTFFGGQGLRAFEASLVTLDTLAFLQIGAVMALVAMEVMSLLQGKVLFPKLSQSNRENPADLRQSFRRIHTKFYILSLVLFAPLIIGATHIIDILYDDRYSSAGAFLCLYALIGLTSITRDNYTNALLAIGCAKDNFQINAADTLLKIISLYIGFWLAGPIGMIASRIIVAVILYCYVANLARKQGLLLAKEDALYFLACGLFSLAAYQFVL